MPSCSALVTMGCWRFFVEIQLRIQNWILSLYPVWQVVAAMGSSWRLSLIVSGDVGSLVTR